MLHYDILKNCEIVTAKTAGVNITVPQPSGDSKVLK